MNTAEHATRGSVITYMSYAGSVGRSTLTALSAATMAAHMPEKRVVLVESPLPYTTNRFLDELRGTVPNATDLTQTLVRAPGTTLDVLLSPNAEPDDDTERSVEQYRQAIETLRGTHDYILIDAPVCIDTGSPFHTKFLFEDADHLIAVVIPATESVANTYEWLDVLINYDNVDPHKICVVLNQSEKDVGWGEPQIREVLHEHKFAGAVPRSKTVLRATEQSNLTLPDGTAHDAILAVLYRVTGERDLQPVVRPKGGLTRRLLQRT